MHPLKGDRFNFNIIKIGFYFIDIFFNVLELYFFFLGICQYLSVFVSMWYLYVFLAIKVTSGFVIYAFVKYSFVFFWQIYTFKYFFQLDNVRGSFFPISCIFMPASLCYHFFGTLLTIYTFSPNFSK